MTFALDMQNFTAKAKESANQVVGEIVVGVARELDMRSPVGDATYWVSKPPKGYVGGRFRANWQLGINAVKRGVVNAVDKNGTIAFPAIAAGVPDDAAGNVFFLSNNLPYAQRIELGWSRQAPTGLVALTAMKFQEIVNKAAAELP
jgi:hypothetical protein